MNYTILSHQHIFEPESQFPQCHASTVEVLPDGTAVAAWFAGRHEKAPDVAIWFSRRENGVWTTPLKIADCEEIPCWNPVLFAFKDVLFLYYKTGKEIPQWQTLVKESRDGGISWSEERELVPGDYGGRGPVKNKCIRLKDGSILAPASVETGSCWDCFTDRSLDGGKTWEQSTTVPFDRENFFGLGLIQPTLWQEENGTVHMLMRSTEGAIFHSYSVDMGKTWSPAVRTQLPNNNCGIDVVQIEDGRLALVYNPVSGNWAARSPIALTISEDNGKTWSEFQILDHVPCARNEERAEFSYPAIVARGNDLYITYTWKRRTVSFWQLRLKPLPKKAEKTEISDGVWVTMVTPFTEENQVDYPALENLVEWYLANGVNGLFATCQSSEIFFLSADERAEIARFVVEKAAGRVPVVASGHISEEIDDQIAELKRTAASGAAAVVLVSNRLAKEGESDEIWKANAEKILAALPDTTFGIYECPYPYKRLISTELLRWCAETGRFAFLKDTSCNMGNIREKLKAAEGTGLKLFNANSATLLESLREGAAGFCGVMANFHPELYVFLTKYWNGNRQQAELLQNFATVTSLIELQLYPINAKYHLNLCGVPMSLQTRSKDPSGFGELRKIETQALLQHWQNFRRLAF